MARSVAFSDTRWLKIWEGNAAVDDPFGIQVSVESVAEKLDDGRRSAALLRGGSDNSRVRL